MTHTYAGVNALRRKMRVLGVSDRLYRIDTIASWVLRISLSYSRTSNWNDERPADNGRWNALYEACSDLLDHAFIRRIVRASYEGLYVDEYQDCSNAQHGIVLKLARELPCRVLGDPMQGIFDFAGQDPIDWRRDVEGRFECLGTLDVPHRWIQAGAGNLGAWLGDVRTRLEQGEPINLEANLPLEVTFTLANRDPQALFQSQGNTCRYFQCEGAHTVIAIHKGVQQYKAKCHKLSRNLGGRFSSIEEIEGKDLYSFIGRLERARTSSDRLNEVIVFSKLCMTAVQQNLPAGTLRGEHVNIGARTRNPQAAHWANAYLASPDSSAMRGFLLALKQTQGVKVVRADLLYRALGVLNVNVLHSELSLEEAADQYHREFRYKGRPIRRRRLIGTTLLIKGLEFDHAIVLDATSLSRKELYVALTRGARSLTIISTSSRLNPE
ncbi:UvrD-helicase domain-containing protein [Marinimicrobium sp. C2-29]|uniref:UvrD-helicase domain-containing protein n=1 Tax=Marinimicrobium sp. C2-29 TaxID=3139825 RepID=UPI0031387BD5